MSTVTRAGEFTRLDGTTASGTATVFRPTKENGSPAGLG